MSRHCGLSKTEVRTSKTHASPSDTTCSEACTGIRDFVCVLHDAQWRHVGTAIHLNPIAWTHSELAYVGVSSCVTHADEADDQGPGFLRRNWLFNVCPPKPLLDHAIYRQQTPVRSYWSRRTTRRPGEEGSRSSSWVSTSED